MKCKVTVGVCVKNCEDYLKESLESIHDQDYPHEFMELIIVDDGSEDNTLSIIEEYVSGTDIRAKIFHTSWKGLGHARNTVVTNAEGDFVLWVDGDMVVSRDFVRKLVEYIQQNPKIGIAKGKQALEHGGNLLATLETYSRAAGRMVDYQSEKSYSKALGTGGSIYRIEALLQAGGFDENLRGYGEDLDIEIRVKAAGWLLGTTEAEFLDYERRKLAWKSLWSRYLLRGYYTHFFLHKNKGMIKHHRMIPPAAFLSGLKHAHILFRLTYEKKVFLLPFHNMLKMFAWYFGFTKSHLNAYEPQF